MKILYLPLIIVLATSSPQAASATQKQLNLVKLHEQSKKNLEQEIANYKEEAQKQRKIIYQLEKERDRYINEASDLTQKVGSPSRTNVRYHQLRARRALLQFKDVRLRTRRALSP